MKLNYYHKADMHQVEVFQACPGCGKLDQLFVRQRVTSYMHDYAEYCIGCNCGWDGPLAKKPIDAATAWDMRFYYIE
jgi:hypothetical protein